MKKETSNKILEIGSAVIILTALLGVASGIWGDFVYISGFVGLLLGRFVMGPLGQFIVKQFNK